MTEFKTIRQAKEHLAGKITDEALRQGVQLTEVERKMLYFTESGWTLPDIMTVSAEFDQGYDRDEYEEKIGRLVRRIEDGLESGDEQEKDDEKVRPVLNHAGENDRRFDHPRDRTPEIG